MNLNFLKNLNWHNDDGINLPMINDVNRNLFYEQIIKNNVTNKTCVDIGFGTGLLSLMALEHGAEKVIAYEKNYDRYLLGHYIIKQLNLESKIELLHKQFDSEQEFNKDYVYISEIVDTNLWAEGLWNVIPQYENMHMLPNNIFFELYLLPINDLLVSKLYDNNIEYFNPGVKINNQFTNLINNLIFENNFDDDVKLNKGINVFPYQSNHDYHRLISTKKPTAYYSLDIKNNKIKIKDDYKKMNQKIDHNQEKIELKIKRKKLNKDKLLLIPRVGLGHKNNKLYLDLACWGKVDFPVIINEVGSDLTIIHNVTDGKIEYCVG